MNTRNVFITSGAAAVVILSLALAPIISAAGAPAPAALPGEGQYIQVIVQPGDSLARYAVLYGVSGAAMLAVNHIPNPDIIYPGQTLTIPVIKTQTPSLTTPFYYVAAPGDTLTLVAERFHQDAGNLSQANGGANEAMAPGGVYLIPAGPHHEIVQRGMHMGIFAAWYDVTIASLMKANPAVGDPSQLLVGQRINIPIIYDAKPRPLPEAPVTATPLPTATGTPFIIINPTATDTPTATTPPVIAPSRTPRPTATSIAEANHYITVVVQPNESLLTYVKRYGADGSAILRVNRKLQINPDLIFPGDVIVIPVVISTTPSRTTPFFYTVQPGETVAALAFRFEMLTDTLAAANPGASFAAGSTLVVPPGPHIYIIQAGESLLDVASKYRIPVSTLLKDNPAVGTPSAVYTGEPIFIPIQYNAAPVPFN